MLISSVYLQNYKSYEQALIRFQPGVNAIIGPNGAGKSSILEAIGFVLFNCRGTGYERRLREGTNRGQVTVSIESSLDEREYVIERAFGENATIRYRVTDAQLNQILAEGVVDAQTWIARHLKVEPGADLATLFENTIGVPQGTFTAPFLLTAAQRKGVFDPLLQVDEYQRASDKLLLTGRLLTKRVTDLQVEVAHLGGLLAELPHRQMEEQTIILEINTLQMRVETANQRVQELAIQLETLDRVEAEVRQIEYAHQKALLQLINLQERLKSTQQLEKEADQARQQCAATRDDHANYIRREGDLRLLSAQRSERDGLLQQLYTRNAEAAKHTVRQQQLEGELAVIQEASAKMNEIFPQVQKQQTLESELRQVEGRCEALVYAQRQLETAGSELEEAETRERKINERLAAASQLESQIGATQTAFQQAQHSLTMIVEARAQNNAEVTRLQTHIQVLATATTARCPVCDLELTSEHRKELLERNQLEMTRLQETTSQLDEDNRLGTKELQTLAVTLKKQQAQLRDFPSVEDYTQAQAITQQRSINLHAAQDEVNALGQAPKQRRALQAQIVALGDPRRSYQLFEAQAKKESAVGADLQNVLQQQKRTSAEAARLDVELQRYANMDASFHEVQQELDKLRATHQLFLANEKTAAEYSSRHQQAEQLNSETNNARDTLQDLEQSLVTARSAYNSIVHQQVKSELLVARNELATMQAQLSLKSERRDEVRQVIAALRNSLDVLGQKQSELTEYTRAQEILDLIRSWLREAGPQVTRQLVARISHEASGIYSDIMDDHTGWLYWSADYEVELETRGARRAFRQLSGGEQMTAALALRLALLHLTSAIDIAFFDEPTAHLDPERRENLAEKITQVKGFSQIFVISHDDTFERTAQSYIRIVKDEHGSHWEGQ